LFCFASLVIVLVRGRQRAGGRSAARQRRNSVGVKGMKLILLMFLLAYDCGGVGGCIASPAGASQGPNAPRPCATNDGKHDGTAFRTCHRTSVVLPEPRRAHRSRE
jgi:hypothetical protein